MPNVYYYMRKKNKLQKNKHSDAMWGKLNTSIYVYMHVLFMTVASALPGKHTPPVHHTAPMVWDCSDGSSNFVFIFILK
jgi:hypothetical protein